MHDFCIWTPFVLKFGVDVFDKVLNMYQISLEEHELVVSYNILKFSRTTLREIYIKSVEEWKIL